MARKTHQGRLPGPRRRRGRAQGRRSATARCDRRELQHLRAAALLRGLPARPRVHRSARHHGAHLRHLPGRLSDERRARDGERARRRGRRADCARCAGCSIAANGSRATRCTSTCCTRRISSATTDAIDMARGPRRRGAARPAAEEGRQRDRDACSAGARSIRSTSASAASTACRRRRELAAAGRAAEAGARRRARTVRWVAGFDFPDCERDYEFVALRHPERISVQRGPHRLEPRARHRRRTSTTQHFEEMHVAHSTALHSRLKDGGAYLRRAAGPLQPELRPAVAAGAGGGARGGLGPVCRNPFQQHRRARRRDALRLRRGAAHHRGLRGAGAARRRRSSRAPASATAHRGAARPALPSLPAGWRTAPSPTRRSCRRPRRTRRASRRTSRQFRRRHPRPAGRRAAPSLRADRPQLRSLHLLRHALPAARDGPGLRPCRRGGRALS